MEIENDPNIVYGGDTSELGLIDGGFGSLGALLINDLKKGGNRNSFVSIFHAGCATKRSPISISRSMELPTKSGHFLIFWITVLKPQKLSLPSA